MRFALRAGRLVRPRVVRGQQNLQRKRPWSERDEPTYVIQLYYLYFFQYYFVLHSIMLPPVEFQVHRMRWRNLLVSVRHLIGFLLQYAS